MEFTTELIYWRGPAPWYFLTMPTEESNELRPLAAEFTYGWGMIPCEATIGRTTWETAMFLKDDHYVVPVKAEIRKKTKVELGDMVTVKLRMERGRS